MQYTSALALLGAATLASAATPTPEQTAELVVLLNDVNDRFADYTSWFLGSGSAIPDGIIDVYMAVHTATDESYTTMFTGVDVDGLLAMATSVPWYSSYLSSDISVAIASVEAAAETSSAAATSAPATSSDVATSASASASASASDVASSAPASASASDVATSANVTSAAATSIVSQSNSTATQETTTNTVTDVSSLTTTFCPESLVITTSAYANSTETVTVCDESCQSRKIAEATTTVNSLTTTTVTSCDEACHASKSAATVTNTQFTTATITSCDEVCHASKSAAAGTTTVKVQVQTSSSASHTVAVQSANGAIKQSAGVAAVLGAAIMLLL